jgi:predicted AlkP superfamily pyrophosphatase or phosphodiesterase
MHLPDYHGGSIVNLMSSIQQGLGGAPHSYPEHRLLAAERIAEYRQVLLWVVDGLGLNYLRAQTKAKHLNANLLGGMTSVYPPTTSTAVTSFLTGLAPQQHGLTGWHMFFHELGAILAILPGRPRYGGVSLSQAGINLQALLQLKPLTDLIPGSTACLVPDKIARSDFTQSLLGSSKLLTHSDLEDLQQNIIGWMQRGEERYLFAYWPELDTLGHREGMWSESAAQHLMQLDRCFSEIADQCRETGTLVILCADHGQIDSHPQRRLSLDDFPQLTDCLAMPLTGEPRSAYCYLRPGKSHYFDQYVTDHLVEKVKLYQSSALIEQGWFGLGESHPQLQRRIGDRVLLMQGDYTLNDWLAQETRYQMIGVHGGLSEDELLVPLIVVEP